MTTLDRLAKYPQVTVIIPVYNGASYIEETIISVLEQTYQDFELLIVNDGSTDNTLSILKKYESNPKVLILNKSNGGLSSARNYGIKSAKGKYISLLDADDLWEKTKLEEQIIKIQSVGEKTGIIFTDCTYIDSRGQVLKNDHEYYHLDENFCGNVYERLISKNQICGSGSAVLIPKNIFEKVGLFDEKLKSCEDHEMWLRIAKKYEVDYVKQRLVKIRVHPEGMQRNSNRMFLFYFVVLARQSQDPKYKAIAFKEAEWLYNHQLTFKKWINLVNHKNSFEEIKPLIEKNNLELGRHLCISLFNRVKRKINKLTSF